MGLLVSSPLPVLYRQGQHSLHRTIRAGPPLYLRCLQKPGFKKIKLACHNINNRCVTVPAVFISCLHKKHHISKITAKRFGMPNLIQVLGLVGSGRKRMLILWQSVEASRALGINTEETLQVGFLHSNHWRSCIPHDIEKHHQSVKALTFSDSSCMQ